MIFYIRPMYAIVRNVQDVMLHYGRNFETRGRHGSGTEIEGAGDGGTRPAGGRPPVFLPAVAGGAQPFGRPIVVPALIADVGPRAAKRFANFFGSIANDNTRAAYQRACQNFFAWCDSQWARRTRRDRADSRRGLCQVDGGEIREADRQAASRRDPHAVRLSRRRPVLAINPAHAVRGPKHSIKRGKTPVLSAAQARQLLDSIDVTTVVGLRDRALIALMTFSFARVGAAVGMRVEDYFADGKRWRLRLNEKGGKVHEMPPHHNLEAYLDAYMHAAGLFGAKGTPCSAPPIGMAAR